MPISLEHLAVQHFEISFSVISVRQFRVFRQRSWHIGHTNDVTESTVTILSPFCGYNIGIMCGVNG